MPRGLNGVMDPPKILRPRSPQRDIQPGYSPWDTSMDLSLPFASTPEHPVDPRPSPKICCFRLCHPISWDQARRGNSSSPKYLGCATSGASRDSPHLQLPHLGVPTGKGQAQTPPYLSWESLPSSSCSTNPCRPTLPPQWGQHLQTP